MSLENYCVYGNTNRTIKNLILSLNCQLCMVTMTNDVVAQYIAVSRYTLTYIRTYVHTRDAKYIDISPYHNILGTDCIVYI